MSSDNLVPNLLQCIGEMMRSLDTECYYRVAEKMQDNITSLFLTNESLISCLLKQEDFPAEHLLDLARIFGNTDDEKLGHLIIDHVVENSDTVNFAERVNDFFFDNEFPEWKKKALADMTAESDSDDTDTN